jgi:hypothetical protein
VALMRWLNKLARAVLPIAPTAYVGIHSVAHAHPAPGWNVGLLIIGALSIVVLVLTESFLRERRPTLHIGRLAGGARIWVEAPRKGVGAKWLANRQRRRNILDATEPEVSDEELSKLGAEFQKWWDKVTRMLREQGFDPWTEYESTPEFEEAYLELRNDGLAFVDRGIGLGGWDYKFRDRFYNPTPLQLWELNRYTCDSYIKPWLGDKGAAEGDCQP